MSDFSLYAFLDTDFFYLCGNFFGVTDFWGRFSLQFGRGLYYLLGGGGFGWVSLVVLLVFSELSCGADGCAAVRALEGLGRGMLRVDVSFQEPLCVESLSAVALVSLSHCWKEKYTLVLVNIV